MRTVSLNLLSGGHKTTTQMKTHSSKKMAEETVSLPDFSSQQIRFTCKHVGKPRVRGEGKRPIQAYMYMPYEWSMFYD